MKKSINDLRLKNFTFNFFVDVLNYQIYYKPSVWISVLDFFNYCILLIHIYLYEDYLFASLMTNFVFCFYSHF